MTLLTLNRVAPGRDEFEPQGSVCSGCSGCADKPRVVSLSQVYSDSAVIEMSLSAQWAMLWNSWIKPLAATVVAAVGCEYLGFSEGLTIGIVVMAFLMGCLVCYEVPQQALKISENLS
jgi:hypothetical protein